MGCPEGLRWGDPRGRAPSGGARSHPAPWQGRGPCAQEPARTLRSAGDPWRQARGTLAWTPLGASGDFRVGRQTRLDTPRPVPPFISVQPEDSPPFPMAGVGGDPAPRQLCGGWGGGAARPDNVTRRLGSGRRGPWKGPCRGGRGHGFAQRTVAPSGIKSQLSHHPVDTAQASVWIHCPSGNKHGRTEPGWSGSAAAERGGLGLLRTEGEPKTTYKCLQRTCGPYPGDRNSSAQGHLDQPHIPRTAQPSPVLTTLWIRPDDGEVASTPGPS